MGTTRYTDDDLINEALKYNHRKEFELGSRKMYQIAIRRNILDDICFHMKPKYTTWTYELVKNKALKYDDKPKFRFECNGAYQYARRNNILDEICSHMSNSRIYWTHELAEKEALKYNSVGKFNTLGKGAYLYALRTGIINQITEHMVHNTGSTDNDAVYLWEIPNTKPKIVKIGRTSVRLGMDRIEYVQKKYGLKYVILHYISPCDKASSIEAQLLKIGKPIKEFMHKKAGTEFREVTDEEFEKISNIFKDLGKN